MAAGDESGLQAGQNLLIDAVNWAQGNAKMNEFKQQQEALPAGQVAKYSSYSYVHHYHMKQN